MKNQKRSRRPVGPLPDDVVMEILSRLPAYDVWKFRRVCQRWRDLISAQYFAEMHVKVNAYSSPVIVVQDRRGYVTDELLLLGKWKPPRKTLSIRKVRLNCISSSLSSCFLHNLSYDGLVVMYGNNFIRKSTDFIIFNPISGDKVTISRPNPRFDCYFSMSFDLYGMFFNPLIKEYCILWRSLEIGGDFQLRMLNLGAQPCCRALKQSASFIHEPRNVESPVVINDATLYWMVGHRYTHFHEVPFCEELIMAFDIKTEEFSVMPHPSPPDDCDDSEHLNMHILKMDGRLSFVKIAVITNSLIINIWNLKNSATRLWMKSYSVSIDIDQFNINTGRLSDRNFGVMAVENGELLLRYSKERVYACNLVLGTVRRIGRNYPYSKISTYVPSLVSLRNCKSEIWI